MPSHLANWMKEEKIKINERNKRIDEILQSGEIGKTINYDVVNYQLMENINMKGKKEDKKMPKKPMKKGKY